MKRISKAAAAAILELAKQNGDALTAEKVLTAARAKSSPLHQCFTWDDTKAGEQWRLLEARKLIKDVTVTYSIGKDKQVTVSRFVSLASDRVGGNGFRDMNRVLSERDTRSELLKTALEELERLKNKYSMLQELANVFAAVDKTMLKHKSQEPAHP